MRFSIIHDYQLQTIRIEPPCPDLERTILTANYEPADRGSRVARLQRKSKSLLNVSDGKTPGIANGGLAPIVSYVLLKWGHDVELIRPKGPVQRLSDDEVAKLGITCPHVLQFIHNNSHGLILHSLSREQLTILCAEIAYGFPEAKIGFVESSTDRARTLHSELSTWCGRVTLALRDRCLEPGARVVVATPYGLSQPDIIGEPCDLLVFLSAEAAVGELGQTAILANGRARLFGILKERAVLAPRTEDLIVAAFGLSEITVPRRGSERRSVEVAWTRIEGGRTFDQLTCPFGLHRDAVVRNQLRNRRLAKLAKGLVDGDQGLLQKYCAALHGRDAGAQRTLVVASTFEHALAIAERLEGWPLYVDQHSYLSGLNATQRRTFETHSSLVFVVRKAVTTTVSLKTIDLNGFDVVVWAAGGTSLPILSSSQLICRPGAQRPLILIDCRDEFDRRLAFQSAKRARHYLRAGWFGVGEDTFCGRIRRFLSKRPTVTP